MNQEETKNPEKSNSQQIVLYCLGLHTQNPELREADLQHNPKRGSGNINRLRTTRKNTTKSKFYRSSPD